MAGHVRKNPPIAARQSSRNKLTRIDGHVVARVSACKPIGHLWLRERAGHGASISALTAHTARSRTASGSCGQRGLSPPWGRPVNGGEKPRRSLEVILEWPHRLRLGSAMGRSTLPAVITL